MNKALEKKQQKTLCDVGKPSKTAAPQRLDSLGADVQRIDAWLQGFAARDAAALRKSQGNSAQL